MMTRFQPGADMVLPQGSLTRASNARTSMVATAGAEVFTSHVFMNLDAKTTRRKLEVAFKISIMVHDTSSWVSTGMLFYLRSLGGDPSY